MVVLGATGSIGRQALEVSLALAMPVVGLAARRPGEELLAISRAHPDARVVATGGSQDERREMVEQLGGRAAFGSEEMLALAATPGAVVVNGVVGAAGLRASEAALRAGNRLALANKESLVAGGEVLLQALAEGGGELVPVDSEHSALLQLMEGRSREDVARILLTASGGPFRGSTREELEDVTPDQALRHPTWDMGPRISVDSATLANKGLEVIEAHHLFGLEYDRIDVVVHPQSAIHSLVSLSDGSLLAHLGLTDMRIPIQYALTHPGRRPSRLPPFDLTSASFTFERPDTTTFRALSIAYAAGRAGGGHPAVYNAADEVAVAAFLAGRLGFLGIPELIERTLVAVDPGRPGTVDEVLAVDAEARAVASSLLAGSC